MTASCPPFLVKDSLVTPLCFNSNRTTATCPPYAAKDNPLSTDMASTFGLSRSLNISSCPPCAAEAKASRSANGVADIWVDVVLIEQQPHHDFVPLHVPRPLAISGRRSVSSGQGCLASAAAASRPRIPRALRVTITAVFSPCPASRIRINIGPLQ